MKKINILHRFLALTIACILFIASMNIVVDMHYCQGHLKSVSFIGKAKNCHEITTQSTCPHHQMMKQNNLCKKDKKDCCDNKKIIIKSDQDQLYTFSKTILSQEVQLFTVAFVEVFLKNTLSDKSKPNFQIYRRPIVQRDISVLYQSFLL